MNKPIAKTTDLHADMPYLLESGEFRSWVLQQRQNAARMVEDLDLEITRLEAEIQARMNRRNDLREIMARADAALNLIVPDITSPTLEEEL